MYAKIKKIERKRERERERDWPVLSWI